MVATAAIETSLSRRCSCSWTPNSASPASWACRTGASCSGSGGRFAGDRWRVWFPADSVCIDTLAGQANEGLLTEDELAEYEAIINAADFITMLKLKARHNLKSNNG